MAKYCICVSVRHSQLQDEHHVGPVLVHVVQRDDVGVLNLLQDVHLPLYLLPPHPSRAGHALPLLDELGSKRQARALLSALLHDGKLPAGTQRWRGRASGLMKSVIKTTTASFSPQLTSAPSC